MKRTDQPYTIIHRPSGKYVLLKKGTFISEHSTKAEAEKAIAMCITPEIWHYDEKGMPIK